MPGLTALVVLLPLTGYAIGHLIPKEGRPPHPPTKPCAISRETDPCRPKTKWTVNSGQGGSRYVNVFCSCGTDPFQKFGACVLGLKKQPQQTTSYRRVATTRAQRVTSCSVNHLRQCPMRRRHPLPSTITREGPPQLVRNAR
jgi:hypothetical protein